MSKVYPPVHYSDYLAVDTITDAQKLKSDEYGQHAHDEMLFIIIHQTYELWFKQILFEVDSVLDIFSQDPLQESQMLTMVRRLNRVIEIQKILINQVNVLETMTPLDFLDFRDFLVPASGFQSAQFRQIETKMGLIQRLKFNNKNYKELLKEAEAKKAQATETERSLFDCLEKWLERTPFLQQEQFDFWKTYQDKVTKMFNQHKSNIKDSKLDDESKAKATDQVQSSEDNFASIFDEKKYQELRDANHWRLSHRALQAALFIQLYRDEPLLQAPFELLLALQTMDENFTQWRQRHAQMAHRMLGAKMGTGGSSGHKYLAAAANKHKVFNDLFNLVTFLVPRGERPELPKDLRQKMNFQYN